jgi:hypothetical protein
MTGSCDYCGRTFSAKHPHARFCSTAHQQKAFYEGRKAKRRAEKEAEHRAATRKSRKRLTATAPTSRATATVAEEMKPVPRQALGNQPRRKGRPLKLSDQVCARDGCSELVPQRALACGDKWCSRECALTESPEGYRLCNPRASVGYLGVSYDPDD